MAGNLTAGNAPAPTVGSCSNHCFVDNGRMGDVAAYYWFGKSIHTTITYVFRVAKHLVYAVPSAIFDEMRYAARAEVY